MRCSSARRRCAQCALLMLSAASVVLGVRRGEVAVVLAKAVRVCLECIGLG